MPDLHRPRIAALWALAGVTCLATVALAQAGLTASEQARLDRGELVARRSEQTRGQMHLMGGQAWQVVDLPPEVVWRAIRDVRSYDHLLPGVDNLRVISRDNAGATIRLHHRRGIVRATYYLKLQFSNGQKIVLFRLDDQHESDLEAGWGFFRVQPYQGGRTLLSYGVQLDLGRGLIVGALRPVLHSWLLRVPQTAKRYIEGSGRSRYVRSSP